MSDTDEDGDFSEVEEATPEDQEEDQVQEQERPLTKDAIIQGLSLLCRTGNGLGHAFVRLDLKDKQLTDITAISSYIHIRFLDVSKNRLTDLSPVSVLTQLLWLKVDNNAVACFKGQRLDKLVYLQWLSLAMNQFKDLEGVAGQALETLSLIANGIQSVHGLNSSSLKNLVTLELRGNRLDTTDGIYLPNLQRLYLAQNVIKRLEGLDRLERLTTLHLRDNQVDTLDGLSFNMKCLQYLNVRGNTISDQNALQSLRNVSSTLKTFVISENPLLETIDHRVWVLMYVPQLERIDKDLVYPDERAEALANIKELQEEEIPEPIT